jgi:serine/threonine protein kinase
VESPEAPAAEESGSTSEILPGAIVSHYEIVRLVGSGAMGDVYEALDLHLERRVALKFLTASGLLDERAVERFRREARVLSAVDHPNICSVYEYDSDRGRGFLAMQLLEGETLADHIQRRGRLEVAEIVSIGRQIAAGLEAAHERRILHRDIKPANLYLARTGQVKILDFGLARASEAEDVIWSSGGPHHASLLETAAGKIMGTAAYMSPEQIQGRSLDTRTDIFSFGLVLYEMATGTHPFAGVPNRRSAVRC